MDVYDTDGRATVMLNEPRWHLNAEHPGPGEDMWWYFDKNPQQHYGKDCCSSRPISFHYITADQIHDIYDVVSAPVLEDKNLTKKYRDDSYIKSPVLWEYLVRVREDTGWVLPGNHVRDDG